MREGGGGGGRHQPVFQPLERSETEDRKRIRRLWVDNSIYLNEMLVENSLHDGNYQDTEHPA